MIKLVKKYDRLYICLFLTLF